MLTERGRRVLELMRDKNKELVYESGIGCYVGYVMVGNKAVLLSLLRLMALRAAQDSKVGELERYTISETGLKLLREKA